ncbi:hypothetical protein N0V90_008469 [Kalmusia sp. IMI 367209]|nr:hypothetical protein N0V90_008469 [Kalmusia sp. IMI 367209]
MDSIVELARDILRNAELIDGATHQDASVPTSDAIPALEVDKARTELLNATHKLRLRVQSPEAYMFEMMWSVTDVLTLKLIYSLRLPHHVPLAGSISYHSIARSVGVNIDILTRLFRYSITIGFFTEPSTDYVAHSDTTRMLTTNADAFDAMGMILNELGPATDHFPEALGRFAGSEEPNKTAYNIANSTELGIYDFLAENPERGRRFGGAMRFFTGGEGLHTQHLMDSFPWTSDDHDRDDFVVVDVGGGHGSVSMKLAGATKHMRFIVQDKEGEIQEGRRLLPTQLKSRIDFTVHDFFTPQTAKGADVYFFRWIFHNWSDKYCIQILRSLVPALKKGARIMVYEHVMEDGVDLLLSKKRERYLDLFMMCAYNSRERTETDWKKLFGAADGRFIFQGATTLPGASLSLIEAVWKG